MTYLGIFSLWINTIIIFNTIDFGTQVIPYFCHKFTDPITFLLPKIILNNHIPQKRDTLSVGTTDFALPTVPVGGQPLSKD